jgi:hypothetical protein
LEETIDNTHEMRWGWDYLGLAALFPSAAIVVTLGLVAVDEHAVECEEDDDHLHESHGCGEEEAKGPFRDAEEEPLEEADPAAHPPAHGRTIGLDAAVALSTHMHPRGPSRLIQLQHLPRRCGSLDRGMVPIVKRDGDQGQNRPEKVLGSGVEEVGR